MLLSPPTTSYYVDGVGMRDETKLYNEKMFHPKIFSVGFTSIVYRYVSDLMSREGPVLTSVICVLSCGDSERTMWSYWWTRFWEKILKSVEYNPIEEAQQDES